MAADQEKAQTEVYETTRLEAICDGVYGVAMTLLVVTFDFTNLPNDRTESVLRQFLWSQWPDLLLFIICFVVISVFWIQHHNQFHLIENSDWTLRWLNIAGLLLVVVIPMTNYIIGDNPHMMTAALLFEGNMFLAGMMLYANWTYATRGRRLVRPDLNPAIIRHYRNKSLVIPGLSLVAIGVAFVSPLLSTLVYLATPLIMYLIQPKRSTPLSA